MATYYMWTGSGVTARANSTAYSLGARIVPVSSDTSTNYLVARAWVWECTTAGTSGAAVPAWPATVTADTTTITDGTVVWTARAPGYSNSTTVNWNFATPYLAYAARAASVNGDSILVQYTSQEDGNAPGTISFLADIEIIAVDKDNSNTPTPMNTNGWIGQGNGNKSITISGGFKIYMYGITLRTTTSTSHSYNLFTSDNGHYELENFYLWIPPGASLTFGSSSAINAYLRVFNSTLRFGTTGSNNSMRLIYIHCEFENCVVSSAGSIPNPFIGDYVGSADVKFIGCNLSYINTVLVPSMAGGARTFQFSQCKLGTNVTPLASQTPTNKSSGAVYLYDCSSGDTHGIFAYYDGFGSCVSDTGIYYTRGVSKQSWKITTNFACTYNTPFVTPFIDFYCTNTTSPITPYIEFLKTYPANSIVAIIYANNQYVAVDTFGYILISQNGTNWNAYDNLMISDVAKIAYGNGKYVIIEPNFGEFAISFDAKRWLYYTFGNSTDLLNIIYANNLFVIVGDLGLIRTSSDGITWTTQTSGTTNTLYGITYGNNQYIAVGNLGTILTSADGITWVSRTSGTTNDLFGITYGNGQYIAVGYPDTILTSSDGITWTNRTSGTTGIQLTSITYGNNLYVTVGDTGTILTSADGITWVSRTSGTTNILEDVTYGNNLYIAVGGNGTTAQNILTSADGITWIEQDSITAANDQVWGEFFINSTKYSDRKVQRATEASQAIGAGKSTWTSAPVKSWSGKLDSSQAVTLSETGYIRGRVVVGEPNSTVYIDPQIRI